MMGFTCPSFFHQGFNGIHCLQFVDPLIKRFVGIGFANEDKVEAFVQYQMVVTGDLVHIEEGLSIADALTESNVQQIIYV
jgi:hypothetical protein